MNKLKFVVLIILSLFLVPNMVNAEVENNNDVDPLEGIEIVSQEIKYYKVVTYYDYNIYETGSILNSMNNARSESFEITEAEYLNAPTSIAENYSVEEGPNRNPIYVETTYKRMVSSIGKNGSYYRYVNSLNWKIMPAVRSNDIIAIGFLSDVVPANNPIFSITYSYSGGGSGNSALTIFNTFNKGVSCTFQMPAYTNINAINMHLSVDVTKANPSSTLTYQAAYADYSHATTATSIVVAAACHYVNQSVGIVLDSLIVNNYDTITEAGATWHGTW